MIVRAVNRRMTAGRGYRVGNETSAYAKPHTAQASSHGNGSSVAESRREEQPDQFSAKDSSGQSVEKEVTRVIDVLTEFSDRLANGQR